MSNRRHPAYFTLINVIFVLSLLLGATVKTLAQQSLTLTSGHTPPGVAPGNPNGNYPLSEIDDVNLFNGNMRIVLPLATVGGRGGAGFAPTLRIQSLAWQAREYVQIGYTPVIWKTPEYTTDTSSNLVGYSPGKMIGVRATDNHQPPDFNCGEGNWETGSLVTRLKFVTTDGTEIWFHDKLYGGQIQTYTWCSNSNYVVNRKRVFVTSNGEAMTFVSDTDITDVIGPTLEFAPSGYLFMRDGARYRIVNGEVITIRDRNGNYIERNPNNSGQYLTH